MLTILSFVSAVLSFSLLLFLPRLLSRPSLAIHEPFRVLDELAEAICALRWESAPRVTDSLALEDQFGFPLTQDTWHRLSVALRCPLPALVRTPTGWAPPEDLQRIESLAACVAQHRPDWTPPSAITAALWREAQIFVRVRWCLMETLCVEKEEVTREATLMGDLGAES